MPSQRRHEDGAQRPEAETVHPEEVIAISNSFLNGVQTFYRHVFGTDPSPDAHRREIALFSPLIWIIQNLVNRAMGIASPPPLGEDPATTPDYEPRDVAEIEDSRIIRQEIRRLWDDAGRPAPSGAEMDLVQMQYNRLGLARQRKDYLGVNALENAVRVGVIDGSTVMFSAEDSARARTFNKCMAAAILKEVIITRINEEAEATERRHSWDDTDKKWLLDTIARIVKHVSYLLRKSRSTAASQTQRRIEMRSQGVQRREYDRRIEEARTLQQPDLVELLQLLGHDGMSSDEEIPGHAGRSRAVHKHPWRSTDATEACVWLSRKADSREEFEEHRRGNRRNERLRDVVGVSDRTSKSRRWQQDKLPIKPNLPRNLYNWDQLSRREEYQAAGLNAEMVARPTAARPELVEIPELI
ncbi:hypothetical protein PQX77_001406 [Marasmius sp. AFHP31]|nr:hypothetical protein PQX77_001406 [Marasmius sp. AFHP31]